jgi:GGDEF domain-containing protein
VLSIRSRSFAPRCRTLRRSRPWLTTEALVSESPEEKPGGSVGVATRTDDRFARVVDLIAACDKALYEAKRGGRNRVSAELGPTPDSRSPKPEA